MEKRLKNKLVTWCAEVRGADCFGAGRDLGVDRESFSG